MHHAIESVALCKEYRRGEPRESWLISALGRRARAVVGRPPELLPHERGAPALALSNVSFAVAPGEALALLGNNGAGKSTLLRIVSRIIRPSSGRATVRGQLQALFEAGAGFERDLSGRENVFLKAAIHNLGERETKQRFDEIVAFAGVEEVIDLPVKRYSSGMRNRLGIAVGLHLRHDVLVLDEALGAVDDAFRARALALVHAQMRTRGVAVLVVSHESAHLQPLCDRGLVLSAGRVMFDGPLAAALETVREPSGPDLAGGS